MDTLATSFLSPLIEPKAHIDYEILPESESLDYRYVFSTGDSRCSNEFDGICNHEQYGIISDILAKKATNEMRIILPLAGVAEILNWKNYDFLNSTKTIIQIVKVGEYELKKPYKTLICADLRASGRNEGKVYHAYCDAWLYHAKCDYIQYFSFGLNPEDLK